MSPEYPFLFSWIMQYLLKITSKAPICDCLLAILSYWVQLCPAVVSFSAPRLTQRAFPWRFMSQKHNRKQSQPTTRCLHQRTFNNTAHFLPPLLPSLFPRIPGSVHFWQKAIGLFILVSFFLVFQAIRYFVPPKGLMKLFWNISLGSVRWLSG